MTRASVSWRFAALPGLFLCWYLLTIPGTVAPRISDDRSMYLVTQAIVDRHDVALQDPYEPTLRYGWQPPAAPTQGPCPTEAAVIGVGPRVGGPVFAKYGVGQSLLAMPLYVLGERAATLLPPVNRPEAPPFAVSAYNSIITALIAMVLCALALRLGWSRRVALALALLFGLATPAWAYTTTFFSEPTIALCLLAAVATVLWREGPPRDLAVALAGIWLGLAMLVRLDSAFYVPLFALYLLARARREEQAGILPSGWPRLLILLSAGPALALIGTGAYDAARFGSPLNSGYGISGDYHDLHPPHSLLALWEGIYGPLLSPGKGLFLYAPALLLLPWAAPRFARDVGRGALLLLLGIAAIDVLAHADTLIVWLGGWAWGPRFLIPIIAPLLLPLGALLQGAGPWVRRAAWTVGLLGVLIQIPAVLLDKGAYITYLNAHDGQPACIWHTEDLYKWHPQYSPLIGQWQRLLDPGTYSDQPAHLRLQVASLRTKVGAAGITTQRALAEGAYTPAPHTWWELLSLQGASARDLAPPLIALSALAALFLWLTLRALGPPSVSF
jgi:hypothetical protein